MKTPRWLLTGIGPMACLCALPALAFAQESRSASLAIELRQALVAHKLDKVAAQVQDQPGTFVAVSYMPSIGLLLISARSSSAPYLADCVRRLAYDEAYTFLNGTALPDGKFFVEDTGADGLWINPRNHAVQFDITWEDVTKQVAFDGDPTKQHLTAAEYEAAFEARDVRYAKLLAVLVNELSRSQQTPAKVP